MSLIKENVHFALQKCFNDYFQLNSILDDYVYFLQNDSNLTDYADFVHEKMSHLAPLFADKLQEWADLREDRLYRSALDKNPDFDSIIKWTKYAYDYCITIEKDLYDAIMIAVDEKDITEDLIRSFFVEDQAAFTHQLKKFLTAIERYEEDDLLPTFNKDFKSYIISYFKD